MSVHPYILDFFPPPQIDPTWGINVTMFELLDKRAETRPARMVELKVDDLQEQPGEWMIVAALAAAQQLCDGVAPGAYWQPRVEVLRNLSEAERLGL